MRRTKEILFEIDSINSVILEFKAKLIALDKELFLSMKEEGVWYKTNLRVQGLLYRQTDGNRKHRREKNKVKSAFVIEPEQDPKIVAVQRIRSVKGRKVSKRDLQLEETERKRLLKISEEYEYQLREKATPSEKKLRAKLRFCGILHQFQKTFLEDRKHWYIVDFYIPEYGLCIEIDGGYHEEYKQKRKDTHRDKLLRRLGYKVWRLTNEEADQLPADHLRLRIEKFCRLRK